MPDDATESLFKRLLHFTGDGVYRYTFDDGRILFANEGLIHILNLDCRPQDIVGKPLKDLLIYTEKEGSVRHALAEHGEIHRFHYHFKTLKGEEKWVIHDSFVVKDPKGGQKIVETIVKDITATKQAEAALEAEKERLAITLKSIGDGVIATDNAGRVVLLNGVAETLTGWSQGEALGRPLFEVFHIVNEFTRKLCENPVEKVLSTGLVVGLANHTLLIARDGTERAIADSGAAIRNAAGSIIGVVLVFRDVTEIRKAEDALAQEKERLTVTLRSIGDGVIAAGVDGAIMLMNKAAEGLTGWAQREAVGQPLSSVFAVADERTRVPVDGLVQSVIGGSDTEAPADSLILKTRDGAERVIAQVCSPIRDPESKVIGIVLAFRDVGEKRRFEEEQVKLEKMESLGVLAGGIAHDFNNILTAILGNISLIRLSIGSRKSELVELLQQVENASLRAKDLTQQLLTFSKGGAPIKQVTSLSGIVRDSAQFALRGGTVSCEFSLPPLLWSAEVDSGQISQVIHNLVINAKEAMPSGGKITIKGENVEVAGATALPLRPGPYVKLSVADTGCGIPKGDLTRIFDPYFSTKKKGTGLGLTTTFSIVKKHDGYITVDTTVGVGTTFHVYLPALAQSVAQQPGPRPEAPKAGIGKILVMDDEESIRQLTSRALAKLGYKVETAEDGAEAVKRCEAAKADGKPFAAVILDLTIPGGMGGLQALARLRHVDPGVKAIVSSGYSTDPVLADYRKFGFQGVVIKPYRINELIAVLHQVLQTPEDDG